MSIYQNLGNFGPPVVDHSDATGRYPQQPKFRPNCQTNNRYKTLPQYEDARDPWTQPLTEISKETAASCGRKFAFPMVSEFAGPSSLRSLYSGPNFYPPQRRTRPVGTMYDMDLGELGFGGRRETYHFRAYPFHHRYAREIVQYRGDILPEPNIKAWQSNPVVESTTDWGDYSEIAH